MIIFFKAHVAGYTRKDGTYVRPHFDKRTKDTSTGDLFAEHAHAEPEKKILFTQKPLENTSNLSNNDPVTVNKQEPKMELEWLAGDGKTKIAVRVERSLDSVKISAYVNGKYNASAANLAVAKNNPIPGVVAIIGNVGLKQDKVDKISDMVSTINSEIDADPEARLRKLVSDRNVLARNVGYIVEAAHEDHVSRVECMSANGFAGKAKRDYNVEEAAARAKLAAFDVMHPSVIEKIKKDQSADNERFLRYD